jgi:fatty acid desaturase
MYFASVILLLVVLPVVSISVETLLSHHAMSWALVGRWFVFWGIGVRLFLTGIRQVLQPRFTAEEIFGIHDPGSFAIVREVGCANLAMGFLGLCTLFWVGWLVPAAVVGGLYYGLAGAGHVFSQEKNAKEYMAMISDGFIFVILLIFVLKSVL